MATKLPLVVSSGLARELADADTLLPSQLVNPKRTQTIPYSNGGLGGSVATSLASATAGSARMVVKLPESVTQWRIKIRNRDYNQTTLTAATLKKLIVGLHSRSNTSPAQETGSFTGNTATTIVSTDQTIPGDGTWYTSPWVSVANGYSATTDVFVGGTEHLVAFGYTFASSTALSTGAGRAWHWTNSTSATDPTVAGSGATQQYIPFDWIIEYQVSSRRKVTLVIGDSISEGITGSNSALSSTPLWRNPFWLWAARSNRFVVNLSLAGVAFIHFATTPATNYLWNRQALTGYTIDEIIISAGSNDFNSGQTLSQMQTNVITVVNYLQSTLGLTAPVYMATLLARGSTGDSVRLSYNEWVSSRPTWCTDVIDFDGATRGTTAQSLVDQYTPDSIHPSWLGCHAMASELGRVMP